MNGLVEGRTDRVDFFLLLESSGEKFSFESRENYRRTRAIVRRISRVKRESQER